VSEFLHVVVMKVACFVKLPTLLGIIRFCTLHVLKCGYFLYLYFSSEVVVCNMSLLYGFGLWPM